MEYMTFILTFIGALTVIFKFSESLLKHIPYLQNFKAYTWGKIADAVQISGFRKQAISSNIESALNQAVYG